MEEEPHEVGAASNKKLIVKFDNFDNLSIYCGVGGSKIFDLTVFQQVKT
jgi:hypothetical protein